MVLRDFLRVAETLRVSLDVFDDFWECLDVFFEESHCLLGEEHVVREVLVALSDVQTAVVLFVHSEDFDHVGDDSQIVDASEWRDAVHESEADVE
jgi:hypothetical protein